MDRFNDLIEALLGFSYQSKLSMEEVDIRALLETVLELLNKEIGRRGIEVVREYGVVPTVRADLEALKQAFLNIALNGVQAMPEGGRLTIGLGSTCLRLPVRQTGQEQRLPVPDLPVRGTQTGPRQTGGRQAEEGVEVRISDTGVGIPEEHLEDIFRPFFTSKESGEGTGLGLAIAYDRIKKHRGDIRVESKKDEGATFTLELSIFDQDKANQGVI